MNSKKDKFLNFLLSALISALVFIIIAVPLFGIFTDTPPISNNTRSAAPTGHPNDMTVFLAFYDDDEFMPYLVTLSFSQSAISLTSVDRSVTKEATGKNCGECYKYGGASYLMSARGSVLPQKIEKFVIITKKNAKKYLDFIGGAIVTGNPDVYNSIYSGTSKTAIFGPDLFNAIDTFGAGKVIVAVIHSMIGESEKRFLKNTAELCESADTDISRSGCIRIASEILILRR